jgi:hypothetical protein
MKRLIVVVSLMLAATPVMAGKSCDELKSEIEGKLTANGVKNFTLTVVPNESVKDQKVVGSCEGGTKKIIYKRG